MLALSSTSASVTWLRPREATRSSMRLRIKRRIRKGLRLMRRSASGSQVICCSDNPHLSLGVLVSEFYRRRILRSVAESTRRVVDRHLESQHNANVTFVFCRPGGYFAVGEEVRARASGRRGRRGGWDRAGAGLPLGEDLPLAHRMVRPRAATHRQRGSHRAEHGARVVALHAAGRRCEFPDGVMHLTTGLSLRL
jgi:hypothetical protein